RRRAPQGRPLGGRLRGARARGRGEALKPVLREVALVFALAVGGSVAFLGLGQAVPFVRANLHAFVAVLFLVVPSWAVARRSEALEDYGLNAKGVGRALAVAGLLMLATFPSYVAGHHYWQKLVLHRSPDFAWSNYASFPEDCTIGAG